MRNPEEILDNIINNDYKNVPKNQKTDFQNKLKTSLTYITCIKAIKESQLEAYNEAIDDALENVQIKKYEYNNPYSESDGNISYSIDKNSLLKLKKKGIKKIYKPGYYKFDI